MTDFIQLPLADALSLADAVATDARGVVDRLVADAAAAAKAAKATFHPMKYVCTYGAFAAVLAVRYAMLRRMPGYHCHEDLAHLTFYASLALLL